MLETRHLRKVYKPKKGVPVEALRDVTLKLPDRGMVFLLGKSGSGKSTLLNVLGGLDRYDGGEIIIKGVSSKDFKQQHFDSYRNTYVGFIFQEYNVLEEFSVGANIALAIELQGRRATDEDINRILAEVDLAGYGNRKPNELSGGQKQRVAIARALVKNPEIIMADEPTGALDSNTGRQVLETLKRLSADKLVLVVSHDREFAERYADRIIELADGVVINDVEYLENAAPVEEKAALAYGDRCITVPSDYRLTEEDRLSINAYLDALSGNDITLNVGAPRSLRRATPTDISRIAAQTGETFRLIKSKLPLKNAFKIGASGLKHKKIRLVVTILLSCIAFGLFGLADTFGAYDHVKTCTNSLLDSNITYATVQKTVRVESGDMVYYYNSGQKISEDDLAAIQTESSVPMNGVFEPLGWDLAFDTHFNTEAKFTETGYDIYPSDFSGLSEISAARLEALGFPLIAGRLPDGGKDEIAVSRYVCERFLIGGYSDGMPNENGELTYEKITAPEQMVGKTLALGEREYTVVGVVDTRLDLERYRPLTVKDETASNADIIVDYALHSELQSAKDYGPHALALVGEGYVTALKDTLPTVEEPLGGRLWMFASNNSDLFANISTRYLGTLSDVAPSDIVWLNGERTTLGEKELVVSLNVMHIDNADGYTIIPDAETLPQLLHELGAFTVDKHLHTDIEFGPAEEGYTVVGYLPNISDTLLGSEALCEGLIEHDNGVYAFAVGAMPTERDEIQSLVSYCYREDVDTRYEMMNPVTYELDAVNEMLQELSHVFLYIGLGFALFAALMLANFISTSIAYKKQEIGILRAIGSRSNDVFRIFFAESFIIAMINFVLSAIGVWIATAVINTYVRNEMGILITVLTFDVRQVILLFAVSLLVAALASFFPVRHIASKRPIDAIRNR